MKKVFVSLLVVFAVVPSLWACVCAYEGSFFYLVHQRSLMDKDFIIRARVTGNTRAHMDVDVLEVFWGDDAVRKATIWGEKADFPCTDEVSQERFCGVDITMFPVGTEWIFYLKRLPADYDNNSYYLSKGGEYWLGVNARRVLGNQAMETEHVLDYLKPTDMALDEFKEEISKIKIKQ